MFQGHREVRWGDNAALTDNKAAWIQFNLEQCSFIMMDNISGLYAGSFYRRKPVPSFRNLTLSCVSQLISTQALTVSRYDAHRLQVRCSPSPGAILTVSRYDAHHLQIRCSPSPGTVLTVSRYGAHRLQVRCSPSPGAVLTVSRYDAHRLQVRCSPSQGTTLSVSRYGAHRLQVRCSPSQITALTVSRYNAHYLQVRRSLVSIIRGCKSCNHSRVKVIRGPSADGSRYFWVPHTTRSR